VTDLNFYGSELANVHHEGFGDIAAEAASDVVDHIRRAGLAGGRVDEHHTLVLFEPERVVQLCEQHGFTVERRSRYGRSETASTAPFGWDVFAATAPRS
jgi:hypothetical protein